MTSAACCPLRLADFPEREGCMPSMRVLISPTTDPLHMQVMKMQRSYAEPMRCSHPHLAILAVKAAILPRDSRNAPVMMVPMIFAYSDC